jgi:glycosyltransferase involved in cell wall biosynthesis
VIASARFVVRILVDYRPALRERTGVGEYVHQTVDALLRTAPADESLVLFSASWKDRLSPGVAPGARIVDRRIPVRALNYMWHRIEWPPVERLAGGDVDVAQSSHPLLMPARRAAQAVLVADLDFLDHPDRTRAEIRRDYPELAPDHVRRADQVIAISDHTARDVQERLGVPPARVTTCLPGAPDWTRRVSEPAHDGYILFLGTLEPRKNVALLLDAYGALLARRGAMPRLVLAGRVVAEAEPLVARVRQPPFAGCVEVTGYVDPARRRALYDGAVVFVLPSHTEGFGMPAVEAMMAGVPVIAADRGALRQSVGGGGRLFDPRDHEALAAALDAVLGDRHLRERMSEAGRRHAEQFTWTRTAGGFREAWALAVEARARRNG